MASAADKKRWDKLHDDLTKIDAAKDNIEIELRAKYSDAVMRPSNRHWMSRAERTKLEKLEAKAWKLHDQIFELVTRISPRDWAHGVPGYWVTHKLTWDDAIRPKNEPLSVVVPGAYGYPDGYVKDQRGSNMNADENEIPIANSVDVGSDLYQFQFGAYADTKVYVWSNSADDAFEVAVEWADDHATGVFTTLTEDDLREAAEDLGIEWDEMWTDGGAAGRKEFGITWNPFDDPDYEKIITHAEADLTPIGWTTLSSGTHVVSYEIHFHQVTDEEEIQEVTERSEDENEQTWPEEARRGRR